MIIDFYKNNSTFRRLVDFLIDKFKASIYDRDKNGSTLMHIAAVNGHPDTAVLLFNKGVKTHEKLEQNIMTEKLCTGSLADA